MNLYYELLHTVLTHQPCTRFHLENLRKGKFKEHVAECIQHGYIECSGKNENCDDLYFLTEAGKRTVDNPKEVT